MLTDEQMDARMRNGWRGGLPETKCGIGSTMESTANIRAWLPGLAKRYDIRTLNNAGCGDLVWFQKLEWDVECRHFDLIPRHPDAIMLDITRQSMPPADAILCRQTLNHIQDRVGDALSLFRQSALYLIVTQFNYEEIDHREFSRLDMRKFLGEPLESVPDGGSLECRLALWAL